MLLIEHFFISQKEVGIINIQKKLLTPNKFSRPQTPLKSVTAIAIHYVGNANSTALGNRNYFEDLKNGRYDRNGNLIYASSHFIVGLNGEVIQCILENEMAYCTNKRNVDTISIENCHPRVDGKFTDATYKSLVVLCTELCKQYNLEPQKDLIRHYDVTGKICPKWFVDHPADWQLFKVDVQNAIDISTIKPPEDVFEMRYDTIDAMPVWARPTIQKLVDKQILQGTNKKLDLSMDMIRTFVINDRAGLYK